MLLRHRKGKKGDRELQGQLPLCNKDGHRYIWSTIVTKNGRKVEAFACSVCGHIRTMHRIGEYHA